MELKKRVTVSETPVSEETVCQRINSLKYMVPHRIRRYPWRMATYLKETLANNRKLGYALGVAMWVVTTSSFMAIFPLFYAYQKERDTTLLEKEQKLLNPG